MTTYRKRLKDKNGDTIIPALSGDETKWIKNSDIGDEVVKSDNIDWATLKTSYTTGTEINCYKVGKICTININITRDSSPIVLPAYDTNTPTVATLPEGFRPENSVEGAGWFRNPDNNIETAPFVSINTSGILRFRNWTPKQVSIRSAKAQLTYVVS